MRFTGLILAIFSSAYSMIQSGLWTRLAEKGLDFTALQTEICALECIPACVFAAAALGALGALVSLLAKRLGSLMVIAAMIISLYVDLTAPFENGWVCFLAFGFAAMGLASGEYSGYSSEDQDGVSVSQDRLVFFGFLAAIAAALFTLYQNGMIDQIVNEGPAFVDSVAEMDLSKQVILASAVCAVLGALFIALSRTLAALLLIAALILSVYTEITVPFTQSWLCVVLYALAAMWGSIRPETSANEPCDNEAYENSEEDSDEILDSFDDIVETDTQAEDVQTEPESSETFATDAEISEPSVEETLEETVEETNEETGEKTVEETDEALPQSAICLKKEPLTPQTEVPVSATEQKEPEIKIVEKVVEKVVEVEKENSPIGTVLLMIVALVIGGGLTSAYWKNELEQSLKSAIESNPKYQSLSAELAEQKTTVASQREQLKGKETELQAYKEQLDRKTRDLDTLSTKKIVLDDKLSVASIELSENKARLEAVTKNVAQLEEALKTAEAQAGLNKKFVCILVNNTFVRSEPSTAKTTQTLAKLGKDKLALLLGTKTVKGSKWFHIKTLTVEGWVLAKSAKELK